MLEGGQATPLRRTWKRCNMFGRLPTSKGASKKPTTIGSEQLAGLRLESATCTESACFDRSGRVSQPGVLQPGAMSDFATSVNQRSGGIVVPPPPWRHLECIAPYGCVQGQIWRTPGQTRLESTNPDRLRAKLGRRRPELGQHPSWSIPGQAWPNSGQNCSTSARVWSTSPNIGIFQCNARPNPAEYQVGVTPKLVEVGQILAKFRPTLAKIGPHGFVEVGAYLWRLRLDLAEVGQSLHRIRTNLVNPGGSKPTPELAGVWQTPACLHSEDLRPRNLHEVHALRPPGPNDLRLNHQTTQAPHASRVVHLILVHGPC